MEENRQFQTPNITPLYPSMLDSCSPFTSPQKNHPQKCKRRNHRNQTNNNSRVVQYGVTSGQLPGAVPLSEYHCDAQVIVKVSNLCENKVLSQKNYSHCKRKRIYLKSASPSKMFIGKLTRSNSSWKNNNNKNVNSDNDCYDKKPIKTLGRMMQDPQTEKEQIEDDDMNRRIESHDGNEVFQIDTVAEVHKCNPKRRKGEKELDGDIELMNEKNASINQEEKADNQKSEISKFKKQTLKLSKIFGGKDPQNVSNFKDVEKAEGNTASIAKKVKGSKSADEHRNSDFSHIEEISEESSTGHKYKKTYQNNRKKIFQSKQNNYPNEESKTKSIGIQATPFPPFRLHFLPQEDWRETDSKVHKLLKLLLSQCGLACIVLTWAMTGALVFRFTEGPQEQYQVQEMSKKQAALVIGLATDLRQVVPQEPIWRQTIENYAEHHEALILSAVSSGYPQRGTIWTYPGSLLFATSLLTTLGFGAPVPRTVIGRMCAIIFAGLGIPMHLLLILNIGLLIAVKLTKLANICSRKFKFLKFKIHKVKSRRESQSNSPPEWPDELFGSERTTPPPWLRFFPFIAIPTYYLTGFLLFGVARGKHFPEVFLFPIDFTSAGGVASTYGPLRIAYAIYLEGAVILASTNVALLRVSATRGFTTAAIKLGLMTNSLQ